MIKFTLYENLMSQKKEKDDVIVYMYNSTLIAEGVIDWIIKKLDEEYPVCNKTRD